MFCDNHKYPYGVNDEGSAGPPICPWCERLRTEALERRLAESEKRVWQRGEDIIYLNSLLKDSKDMRDALKRIYFFPIHSEPVGAAYAMQDIAHEVLNTHKDCCGQWPNHASDCNYATGN